MLFSLEALTDHFGAYTDDPLPAFRNHRQQIWNIAAKLIAERRFQVNGTIMIQSADLEPTKSRATAT